MLRRHSFAIVVSFALLVLPVASPAATLPTPSAVPGGIAIVPLPASTTGARYGNRSVMVLTHDGRRYAVVGLPLDTQPGEQTLVTSGPNGHSNLTFTVSSKTYATQRLTIRNKSMVTLSAKDLKRVRRESKIIDGVYDDWTPSFYAQLPFSLPVQGPETSPFGVQRILNGKPRSPHSGIDIAAPAGTPVRAPADGIVALTGNFFFNGNSVFINHGEGLVSVYVHLKKILVKEGEHVQRGEVIGKLGATGRTTGPDLHWTVTLNGTHINPELLVSPAALADLLQ